MQQNPTPPEQQDANMVSINEENVTTWLQAAAAGETEAKEKLFEATYTELRKLAKFMMSNQVSGHTLQATALLNEAAIRLMGASSLEGISDSRHFFASIAKAMRCVLVDHARKRKAKRRGGDFERLELDAVLNDLENFNRVDIVELDEALTKLAAFGQRHADLVHYRFFLGMTIDEIAKHRGVSKTTVERDWRFTRAWLAEELEYGSS